MKSTPESRARACAHAQKTVAKTFEGSHVQDNKSLFPRFRKDELTHGKLLGKGAFGTVYEIKSFDPSNTQQKRSNDGDDAGGLESRQFIAKHCIREGGDARYAVKALSPEVVNDLGMFLQGIQDMAVEMRFFSDIEHPNIIKLRALPDSKNLDETSFIVMDRLYDTLEQRIKKWETRQKRMGGLGKLVGRGSAQKKAELFEERVVAAFDLSSAFEYLHSR